MNKSLVSVLTCTLFVVLFNCKSDTAAPSENTTQSEVSNDKTSDSDLTKPISTYFIGFGSDSIWTLDISNQFISFSSEDSTFENFKIKTPGIIRAADANIKRYQGPTALGDVVVTIAKQETEDQQSKPNYKTTVEFTNKKDKTSKSFEGFGKYVMDYRLNATWILESIGNVAVSVSDFNEKLPFLIIDTVNKTYSGFSGCNGLGGTIFSENDLLRFKHGMSTLMACPDNKEKLYRKKLQASTQYKVTDSHLELSNPEGATVTFKKAE
ncbi:META domain-containing protein [Bizionia saleffrena]|uniref:META domain-containing protein n=1 Tax=Bizionia saleffrena TaxID=291189 RepID=A0A8H2QJH8_9FLAO|nr:META domain-containing protein [Bizionia saleffrena]TYB74507.1 META domain-containing protein [Bizionia saleffrena]